MKGQLFSKSYAIKFFNLVAYNAYNLIKFAITHGNIEMLLDIDSYISWSGYYLLEFYYFTSTNLPEIRYSRSTMWAQFCHFLPELLFLQFLFFAYILKR